MRGEALSMDAEMIQAAASVGSLVVSFVALGQSARSKKKSEAAETSLAEAREDITRIKQVIQGLNLGGGTGGAGGIGRGAGGGGGGGAGQRGGDGGSIYG
jgi:hypothetical protein